LRLSLGASFAVCAVFVLAVTATAAQTPRALANCAGHPQVKPATVLIACADGNFGVGHLTWVGWGDIRAVGLGSAFLNDCTPDCAAGHFHNYPAVVIVSGSQRCPNGELAYLTITYAFIGRSPFPDSAPGTIDPRETARCGMP
jgi:hypothetical protein